MGNRILYIDKLKGFAILFVVMGHLTDKSLVNEGNLLNDIIYSVHMPLFMFLSGLFAFNKTTTFKNMLYKRFSRLMMPYFFIGGGVFADERFRLSECLGIYRRILVPAYPVFMYDIGISDCCIEQAYMQKQRSIRFRNPCCLNNLVHNVGIIFSVEKKRYHDSIFS